MHVFIDFETRSPADLRRVGAWAYAEHPQTVATHLAYALDSGPVSVWEPGQPFPPELRKLAAERCIFVAHNMQFDRRIWNLCLTRYVAKLPRLEVDRVACSAAAARILGLPGALDALAAALNIGVSKDLEGRRLMLRYAAKPDATPTPDEAARIREYAATDIRVLQRVWSLLPRMTPQERDVWVLDQIVNDRGIPINTREVQAFHDAARDSQRLLNARIAELTGGYVRAVTEASKLLEWIRGRGYDVDSVSDFALRGLDTSSDPVMQEVVRIRTDGAKASVRKFGAMLECVSSGSRLRDQYAYAGANTGRWSGRLVQPQNLKRIDPDKDTLDIETALEVIRANLAPDVTAQMIEVMTGVPALRVMSKCLRSVIQAPAGHVFYGGDFKNIEGRFNAWVAGEDWKLRAFREFDAGSGPDIYKLMYHRAFNTPLESISKSQRQIGKVMELALGYQGGVRALITMGPTYGLELASIVSTIREATPPDTWNEFERLYSSAMDRNGLDPAPWIAAKVLIRAFRKQNAAIAAFWHNCQEAAVRAVESPRVSVQVPGARGVTYMCTPGFLMCRLPSGRCLAYSQPAVVEERLDCIVWFDSGLVEDTSTYTPEDIDTLVASGKVALVRGRPRKQVRFQAYLGSKRVSRRLYGGLQVENIVQSGARDVEAESLLRLERSGYPVVLHTHDDIVSECFAHEGSLTEFSRIMSTCPAWLPEFPLAVDAWTGDRYG